MTSENTLRGFPPVADPDARILILGSMPGEESLRLRQYYGHRQNQFWDIMGDLFGAGRDVPYVVRLQRLRARRIGLWDVVQECRRQGSLDAAIEADTVRPNDFAGLFASCPGIEAVFFNGQKAAALFHRHVRPGLLAPYADIETICLPSTSPAYASLSREAKGARWIAIRERLA
jgi:TDG/mug DNA glycosylase family protein